MMNYDRIFSVIASTIEKFVLKHGMVIEKYPHEGANWTLFFKRKIGGVVQICINYLYHQEEKASSLVFDIIVIWSLDDYEKETRHIKWIKIGEYIYKNNLSEFAIILDRVLEVVKNLKFADLDRHVSGMKDWKKYWKTKNAFEEACRYPVLDI